jgi:hypothetical protein
VLPVTSEWTSSHKDGKLVVKRYFVIADAPSAGSELEELISVPTAAVVAEEVGEKVDARLVFFARTASINEDFQAFVDPDCMLDCDQPTHIWEAAQGLRLAAVYVRRDRCQVYIGMVLDAVAGPFGRAQERRSQRRILDAQACMTDYGYIPTQQ